MNIKMKIKYLLTISLAVLLSACNNQNSNIPIQSDSGGYDNDYNSEYQNAPLTNIEALATGVVTGAATGYAFGKYANKPRPRAVARRWVDMWCCTKARTRAPTPTPCLCRWSR